MPTPRSSDGIWPSTSWSRRPSSASARWPTGSAVKSDDLPELRTLVTELEDELVPHELAEEDELYPLMSKAMGGDQLLTGLSRTHSEIEHQVRRLRQMVDAIGAGPLEQR